MHTYIHTVVHKKYSSEYTHTYILTYIHTYIHTVHTYIIKSYSGHLSRAKSWKRPTWADVSTPLMTDLSDTYTHVLWTFEKKLKSTKPRRAMPRQKVITRCVYVCMYVWGYLSLNKLLLIIKECAVKPSYIHTYVHAYVHTLTSVIIDVCIEFYQDQATTTPIAHIK